MDSGMTDGTAGGIIFFDGVCIFCRRWARFVLRRDRQGQYGYAWLQSVAARRLLEPSDREECDAVILLQGGRSYRKTDAVLRIVAGLGGIWKLAAVFLIVPVRLRDGCYDSIGRRRYRWFGHTAVCERPPGALADRFIPDGQRVEDEFQEVPK